MTRIYTLGSRRRQQICGKHRLVLTRQKRPGRKKRRKRRKNVSLRKRKLAGLNNKLTKETQLNQQKKMKAIGWEDHWQKKKLLKSIYRIRPTSLRKNRILKRNRHLVLNKAVEFKNRFNSALFRRR